jgi:hypothetical protein
VTVDTFVGFGAERSVTFRSGWHTHISWHETLFAFRPFRFAGGNNQALPNQFRECLLDIGVDLGFRHARGRGGKLHGVQPFFGLLLTIMPARARAGQRRDGGSKVVGASPRAIWSRGFRVEWTSIGPNLGMEPQAECLRSW